MSTQKLAILQSGFLAYDSQALIKSKEYTASDIVNAAVVGDVIPKQSGSFFYHPGAQNIFDEFTTNPKIYRDFGFRERVLKLAKEVFGVENGFSSWFKQQENSRYLTNLHREFLNDTIRYLDSGVRQVGIESWYGLIKSSSYQDQNKKVKLDMSRYFNPQNTNHNVVSDIQNWVMKDDGFKDLIYFLGIVFGERRM